MARASSITPRTTTFRTSEIPWWPWPPPSSRVLGLEKLLQHDPLGLDKEIQNVQEAAEDGRAQQICSIKDILERLSEDNSVFGTSKKTSEGTARAR